mgnify:CR=1 FL=1|jgi:drug/metabolite transporter (DMT)-like permease
MLYYLLLGILVVSSSFRSYIKKIIINDIGIPNLLLMNLFMSSLFTVCYLKYNNYKLTDIQKLKNTNTLHYILLGYILGYSGYLASLYLIKRYKIINMKLITVPITLILTIIIGKYLFNENITQKQLFGASIIILGTFVFLYN